MKLYFLESGIDSLRKGFESLIKFENSFYIESNIKESSYFLKDAILYIQHGVETLLKHILIAHSEYLIFSQIDENVKKAYIEKNNKKLDSVFESSLKQKLHTVTFIEAIERVKMLPTIDLSRNLEKKLKEIEVYRNIIMHSEVHLSEIEINNSLEGFSDELDMFFYKSIGSDYTTISGYSLLEKHIADFKMILGKNNLNFKSDVIEIFLKIFQKCGISIGINEVKRITDINIATQLFTELFNSELFFGMDLYNGFCSGNVKAIKRIDDTHFSIYTEDNDSYYDFKFKSLILLIPELKSNNSPIIFIEADKDIIPESIQQYVDEDNKIKMVEYIDLKDSVKKIYNPSEISEIWNSDEYNRESYKSGFRFFTQGIICFINIQKLEYNSAFQEIIYRNEIDGKSFEVQLRNAISKGLISIS